MLNQKFPRYITSKIARPNGKIGNTEQFDVILKKKDYG